MGGLVEGHCELGYFLESASQFETTFGPSAAVHFPQATGFEFYRQYLT
jgi:hypothetical protein